MKKNKILFCIIVVCIILIVFNVAFLIRYHAMDEARTYEEEDITKFEWISLLGNYTGVTKHTSNKAYFEDVPSESQYFDIIQSMVEWGYISPEKKFNGDKIASGRFIAISAFKSIGEKKIQAYLNINKEITDKEYLRLAIEKGVIEKENINQGVSEKEAKEILEKINELFFSDFWATELEDITYLDDIIELSSEDIDSYNGTSEEIILTNSGDSKVTVGDLIVFSDSGFVIARKIKSESEHLTYDLEIPKLDEVIDTLNSSDIKSIGFEDIVKYYGKENLILVDNTQPQKFQNVSHTISKSIQSPGFSIEVKENSKHKLEIFVTDSQTGDKYKLPISPQISDDWGKYDIKLDIKSFFVGAQIKYSRQEGIEYLDIATDIQSNFKGGISGSGDIGKILLAKAMMPLANGVVGLDVEIYMVTTLEGEIALQVECPLQNTICYEKGKGIRNVNQDVGIKNPEIQASGELSSKLKGNLGLIICGYPIIDGSIDFGVTANAEIIERDNKQICSDIKIAFPTINIIISEEDYTYHGKETFFSENDIKAEFHPLNFENTKFHKELHYEILPNGVHQYVEKCTYSNTKDSISDFKTYTTQYNQMYKGKIPTFQFDYPEGWSIITEGTSEESEYIELTNNTGVIISYQYIVPEYAYGSSRVSDEILVEKVTDSKLILDDTLQSGELRFVVAKVYTITSTQHFTAQERNDESFATDKDKYIYAVKPESECGSHTVDGNFTAGFEYEGLMEFKAEIPDNISLETENEILFILSSLRSVADNTQTEDSVYDALSKGDYSYFAGTYKACDYYGDLYGGGEDINNLILQDNGVIIGGGMWYQPDIYPDSIPVSVKKQEDGSYLCQVTYVDETSQNYFIIYPKGVIGDNPYTDNDPFLTENVYIKYMQINGGISDIIYYKIEQ